MGQEWRFMDKRLHFSIWYFVIGLILIMAIQDWLQPGHNVEMNYSDFQKALSARQFLDGDDIHARVFFLLSQNKAALVRVVTKMEDKETLSGPELWKTIADEFEPARYQNLPISIVSSGSQHA